MPTRKPSTDKNANKPWVSNYPPLQEWLDRHEARCLHQLPQGDPEDPQAYLETWQIPAGNLQPFLIQVRANQNGWNIFTALNTPSVDISLLDAEQRLGIPIDSAASEA